VNRRLAAAAFAALILAQTPAAAEKRPMDKSPLDESRIIPEFDLRIRQMKELTEKAERQGSGLSPGILKEMQGMEKGAQALRSLALEWMQYPRATTIEELDQERADWHARARPLYEDFKNRWEAWDKLHGRDSARGVLELAKRGEGNAEAMQALIFEDFKRVASYTEGLSSSVIEYGSPRYMETRRILLQRRRLRAVGASSAAVFLAGLGALWARRRRNKSLAANAEPASDLILGVNFRILGELGRGGMGVVFEAVDQTLQRKVAIKRMREEICQSPRDLDAFLAEARVVAALRHPNIVEIHSVFREGGLAYLVFEHVDGRPLSRMLEPGPLPWRVLLGLLSQIASALDYAHSRKVIHRDLKPANIMVTGQGIAKVMDFGLAHQAKMTVAKLTRADPGGTPAYMAPEQELGSVSRESDLYSLGACVYEMAVGKPPFVGPNFLAQKRELRYAAPSRAAGLPAAFDSAIARALAPDPSGRFHSATELFAAARSAGGPQ